jgi:thymidylate synthase ThyX
MDNHAQWEIRKAAEIIYDIVMEIAPALFEDLKTS